MRSATANILLFPLLSHLSPLFRRPRCFPA